MEINISNRLTQKTKTCLNFDKVIFHSSISTLARLLSNDRFVLTTLPEKVIKTVVSIRKERKLQLNQ